MQRYEWQEREVRYHALDLRRAEFCSPRTGKTLATCDSLQEYMAQVPEGPMALRKILVVAPLTYVSDWGDYLERIVPGNVHRAYDLTSKEIKFKLTILRRKKNESHALIISYDKLANIIRERRDDNGNLLSTAKSGCIDELLKWKPDAVIIDESHRIAGVMAKQARACRRLAWNAKWVRILTGTPIPNSPASLWGQMVCLDPTTWHAESYGRFKELYLCEDHFIKGKILGWKDEATKAFFEENIRQHACIVHREDVFGPDSRTVHTRNVPIPPQAWKVYHQLARQWVAELENGTNAKAKHMLTRMIRLQQVCCGFVRDENGEEQTLHRAKAQAIAEDLSEIIAQGEKVVIFYKFVREGEMIREEIERKHRHVWFRHIDGGVGADDRKSAANAFNSLPRAAVILAQIKTLSEGVSLAEARHVFYASQTFSFVLEEQSRDRVYKRGEDGKAAARCVTYYRVPKTIEDFIAQTVERKVPMHREIMSLKKENILCPG